MASEQDFTARQQAFIDEYLKCWNAAKAAINAGYSEKTAASIGSQNLRKLNISTEIQRRIKENAMGADEALSRLAEQARGNIDDFITLHSNLPFFDLEKARASGKTHLIKKLRVSDKGIEIELYDAQSALTTILKELHLDAGEATERLEINELSDEERATRIAALLGAARARRTGRAADDEGAAVE